MTSCTEAFGDKVEGGISGFFRKIGDFVGSKPRKTIAAAILLTVICGAGFARWETENRPEELWVPQGTTAEEETIRYQQYFASSTRFNNVLVQSKDAGGNVLTKETLEDAMQMHMKIASEIATVDDEDYDLVDLCVKGSAECVSRNDGECQCVITSILRQWNYDLTTLQSDTDVLKTINAYGSTEDLKAVLGKPVFSEDGELVSAEAFTLSYFLEGRSEVVDGSEVDPINEGWELDVFLANLETVSEAYPSLSVDYFAGRSFEDEFGGAITGDLVLVQVSYILAFLYLGATMGKVKCGPGSRWTLALGALVTVGLSTGASFGLSSAFGLFFGPVHSLLPFILLGIGVDDAFVIVNAFNRERNDSRKSEDNEGIAARSGRALARAGASITVTSATDLVAFGISSSSRLPALASFCAFASIGIFFLWAFASTFFTATLVLDERRQRDNRRECLCCVTRKQDPGDEDDGFEEDMYSRYFRNYHAPAILSKAGKIIVLLAFAGLFSFGVYGAINLPVEDTEREFIPDGSYLKDYFEATDDLFPSRGIDLFITFEGGDLIYESRQELAELDSRLTNLSTSAPYIAEPVSEEAYQNVMTGLYDYLKENGSGKIGGVALGEDMWPTTEADFVLTLANYTSRSGPGTTYFQDVIFSEDATELLAFRVNSEYSRLTKISDGRIIDDADRQIDAMETTRELLESWDDLPSCFPYSEKFIAIEGFKIIRKELFMNVGLSILAVGLIVFFTVASPGAAILITLNVACCLVEILGFMYALGIAIDTVSVINIVLAVGLSVDYSAHVGHCFMVKGGEDKDRRALESLADIGSAVLSGATSTFLAVVVLLFSSSYVFEVLSRQFALTVALGVSHGLILLPVLLSLIGPQPFSSAEVPDEEKKDFERKETEGDETGRENQNSSDDSD
mmetsp:Transcript_11956/g.16966  ORF Transcript_11956/g.16966 Transcript_11956/m.16966 type:complete len:911 (-) Transcript_11956:60-2792(-)